MGTILVHAQRARGENRKRGEIRGKGRDPLFVKCPHLFVIGCNVYSARYVTYMYVWIIESLPPPPPRETLYFLFAKIVRMIVSEYEQRTVHKRCNVVDNSPGCVHETGVIYRVN